MPNTKSAEKALRQTQRHYKLNLERKRVLKTTIKTFNKTLSLGDTKKAEQELVKVYEVADKIAKTGYIKKNKASRIKSRSAKALARASQK